jgi:hypothetical protein
MVADRVMLEEIAAAGGRLQRNGDRREDKNEFSLKLVLIRRMQDRGLVAILREIPDYRSGDLREIVAIQVKILDAGRRVLSSNAGVRGT